MLLQQGGMPINLPARAPVSDDSHVYSLSLGKAASGGRLFQIMLQLYSAYPGDAAAYTRFWFGLYPWLVWFDTHWSDWEGLSLVKCCACIGNTCLYYMHIKLLELCLLSLCQWS